MGVPAVPDIESELLRKRESAKLTGLTERTLDKLRDAGRFPKPIALSKRTLRWRRSDLLTWISNGCPAE